MKIFKTYAIGLSMILILVEYYICCLKLMQIYVLRYVTVLIIII